MDSDMDSDKYNVKYNIMGNTASKCAMQSSQSNIDVLIRKKEVLDDLLKNKRHLLSEGQIIKINVVLNKIVHQLTKCASTSMPNSQQHPQAAATSVVGGYGGAPSSPVHGDYGGASSPPVHGGYGGAQLPPTVSVDNTNMGNDKLSLAIKLFKLGSTINYITQKELHALYKKLALLTHPDKNNGNATKFNIVKECYNVLVEHIRSHNSSKPFYDLKSEYANDIANKYPTIKNTVGVTAIKNRVTEKNMDELGVLVPSESEFNVALFNKYYDANRMEDVNDIGYQEWFTNTDVNSGGDGEGDSDNAVPILNPNDNITPEIFNALFQQHKQKVTTSTQLTKYEEPTALMSCANKYTALDCSDVPNDFTKAADEHGLHYCDLKTAYTARGLLIEPSTAKPRKTFTSLQEYEKERANISYTLSPEEHAELAERTKYEAQQEELRLQKIAARDTATEHWYNKIHTKLLGYAPSSN
jgi:hypothetical protein